MPIGSFTATPEVWAGLIESPFLHTSTFGGNQMACVAGLATLKVIEEEDLLNRGAVSGAYLKKGLEEIQKDYPLVIKEVRGRGMMIGIELTKEGAGGMLMSLMIDSNILIAYTLNNPKVIRMEPSLIMPIEVIDQVLEAFRKAIQQTNAVIEEL
jgi:putrescine aminotransferase